MGLTLEQKNAAKHDILAFMSDFLSIARSLPKKPGVYLYHNNKDEVIYVGKAINLRNRVSSYFTKSNQLSPPKQIMITEIGWMEHILVKTETEALLLESTLIKKFRPKYNVLLKDDKFFQYIKIALADDFPQVSTVRRITLDGSRYFGPYTSGFAVRHTLKLLKRLFPFKSCNNKPEVPCFDYQLGRCLGHDTGPDSRERYRDIIKKLLRFLEGETGGLLRQMKADMLAASKRRDFEMAALFRDRLGAFHHILEQQTVITTRRENFDVLALARVEDLAAVNLFQVRQGKLVQRDQFILQHIRDQADADILGAFIEQYYTQSTNHPADIYSPVTLPTRIGQALQLRLHQAQRGLKRKLVAMGTENAEDYLRRERDRWLSDEAKAHLGLTELARALNLPNPPKRIEMYDVSHHQSAHVVGSMVVFTNGLPKKSDYRKFTIKNTKIPDDQHRLAEILQRRFARRAGAEEDMVIDVATGRTSSADPDVWPLPDLLLLDGGKGQLSVVLKSVPGLAQHVPVAALAKEHEELFVPGRSSPIRLPAGSQELFLIQRIRDEAHRFAIGFYRAKHRRATTRSILDEIPGLGDQARTQLLRAFGTIQKIQTASDDEIAAIIGIKKAALVRAHL